MAAIETEGLVKVYRSRGSEVRALDGVDLEVPAGTVLGLLGPNGAGKTTTVRILTTLLRARRRHARRVAGLDVVARRAARSAQLIGLAGQYAAVDENLTGRENLEMVGRLYRLSSARRTRAARRRAARAVRPRPTPPTASSKTYSGGMRRRLDLAASARRRPAGAVPRRADDRARPAQPHRRCGTSSASSSRDGTTRAADHPVPRGGRPLADDIVVIDHGRVIARRHLGRAEGARRRRAARGRRPATAHDLRRGRDRARRVGTATRDGRRSTRVGSRVARRAAARRRSSSVVRRLGDAGDRGRATSALRRPTLDDVFLTLTGHAADEAEAEDGGDGRRAGRGARGDEHVHGQPPTRRGQRRA